MSGNEQFTVKLTYVKHTPNALQVESGTSEEAWMPFNCIEVWDNIDTMEPGTDVTADVPEWLLIKYGLDDLT